MRNRQGTWAFRIGITFSLFLGAAWGILLGWLLVQFNAPHLQYWAIAALPVVFFGSMMTALAFSRLVLTWPRVARLLVAVIVVVAFVPLGALWNAFERDINIIRFVGETGDYLNMEWIAALVGLFAGMWPGWTKPILSVWGRFFGWLFQHPIALLEAIGRIPLGLLNLLARLLRGIVTAILWLPVSLVRLVVSPFQKTGSGDQGATRVRTSNPARSRSSRRKAGASIRPMTAARAAKLNGVPKGSNNHNGSARVVGYVEDRCPYCFDIVKRNDPRGVKVCEVCGTPHHADCWAITGKCQVPHLNT